MKIKQSISILLVCASQAVFADCSMPQAPFIPSGNTATKAEMRAAGVKVRAYIAEIGDYRLCIKNNLERKGDPPPEESYDRWVTMHNQSVDQEEYVANMFNAQIRLFKAR